MRSDRRTSARDLLTLSQKVSILLQRQSDKLLAEIEDAEGSLTPEEEAHRSEQCQQAIDLRRNVWEKSKLLKSALDHVEEIDDEDEARILREPMDALQVYVKEALQVVSATSDTTKTSKVPGITSSSSEESSAKALPIPAGFAARSAAGSAIPSGTPPGLSGSLNRHPLGLFSTSPNFGAQSPFASPKRLSGARFPQQTLATSSTEAEADVTVVHTDPLSTLPSTSNSNISKRSKENIPTVKSRPGTSGLSAVSLDDGPLSIATTSLSTTVKPKTRGGRVDASLDSAATASSLSSTASFSTPITSPLDTPISPPTNTPDNSSLTRSTPKQSTTSEGKSITPEIKPPKTPETVRGPQPVRRVPRGLFSSSTSSTSTSGSEPNRISGFGPLLSSETTNSNGNGYSFGNTPVASMDQSATTLAQELLQSPTRGRTPTRTLSPGFLSASRPHSPPVPSTPTNGPRSPTSPRLQRTQPKPSPIQTAPTSPVTDQFSKNGEEQMSRLARDLERAMNPTPTEPVPQPYFLQGEGLLERIPNQDSMDDGLHNDDQDDQYSEESDRNEGQDGAPGLSRGNGSLRRQRSGKRRFRISRSRSRNRSKGRQERNKPELIPIEIGYSAALTSSEWPFDKEPTLPPSQSSLSALQQHQQQQRQRYGPSGAVSRLQQGGGPHQRSASQPTSTSQPSRAGPHLPFAESVTVGNPIRVGRGIGSFTVYNVSLTLCDPAKARVPPPPRPSQHRNREDGSSQSSALHAGRAGVQELDSLNHNNTNSAEQEPTSSTTAATSPGAGATNDAVTSPLAKPPSKAALMMTRSLSFPELGDSAQRLLMEIRSMENSPPTSPPAPLPTRPSPANAESAFLPPLLRPQSAPPVRGTFVGLDATASRATSAQQVTAAYGQGYVSPPLPTRVITGAVTPAASSTLPSEPRVIHVRKRYTDFVTLRAQLVETFREPRKGGIRNARRLFSRSSSMASVSTAGGSPSADAAGGGYCSAGPSTSSSTPSHRVSPHMSNEDDDEDEGNDDDYDEYEDNRGYGGHSRVASLASMASSTSSSQGSIIRGMPKLPPKKVVGKFRPAFVEKRRRELEYFLEWVVAHPIMGDSPVVVQWFLGPTTSPTI
ncbi:hypothetical protein BGX33_001606 [Mortierella sp. NVP41]|nr:hypothetical protein BGX33_001606 [Mortierella sp. NVP41]